METIVNIVPHQNFPAPEFMAMEGYIQSSMDRAMREMIFSSGRFTGLNVVKSDPLTIKVGAGCLWKSGGAYPLSAQVTKSLNGQQPNAGSSICLVYATPDTVLSAPEMVKIRVDANSNAYVPQLVSTRKFRVAAIDVVVGPASASPSRPAVPAGAIVLASFALAPTGIVDDPVMETPNQVVSLESLLVTVALMQAKDKKTDGTIATLRSDLAGLAKEIRAKAESTSFNALVAELLIIKEKIDVPDTASIAGYDDFSSDSETDGANTTALIEAGYLKFGTAPADRKSQLITLAVPNDPKLDVSANGLILPKSTDALRIEVDEYESDLDIASYPVTTWTLKHKSKTRSYLWYQEKAPYAELEAKLKQKASVRVLDPKTDQMVNLDLRNVDWELVPRGFDQMPGFSPYYRIDVSSETWDVEQTTINIQGSRCAETFLCAQAGWHKRIDLYFAGAAATGDVHVTILKTLKDGSPNRDQAIATTTKAVGTIKKGWVAFYFDPFFLQRGERYAILVQTIGNHKLGVSKTNDYANGTLFLTTDGEYFLGQLDKDLCFRLYGCKFAANTLTIDIGDITLAAGIRQLQAALTGYQPKGTDLVVRARIAGVWRNVGETDASILSTGPTQIPLQLTFVGSKDLHAGIDLTASRIIGSKPLSTCTQVSTARTLPSGVNTNSVKLEVDTVGFDDTIHSLAVSALYGAGYASQANFSSYSKRLISPGRHRHYITISGLPSVNAYKRKLVRNTANVNRSFAIDKVKDWATAA